MAWDGVQRRNIEVELSARGGLAPEPSAHVTDVAEADLSNEGLSAEDRRRAPNASVRCRAHQPVATRICTMPGRI